MDWITRELLHALRSLRRNPMFAAIVVATLALGIGGNTLLLGVIKATFFSRLPFPQAGRVLRLEASYRNPDGSIKRLRNSIVTEYWSGYAVTALAPYTSASATFQVPSVSYDGLANATEYVSQWVGVGGYGDATLIQLGAMEWVGPSGGASYVVWYELYPAGALEEIPTCGREQDRLRGASGQGYQSESWCKEVRRG